MTGNPPDQIRTELLTAVREVIRLAVMTLNAVRDPDRRYLGWAKLPATVVHDVADAYGYSTPAVRKFQPTGAHIDQMERVMPWLSWLRREEGQDALRRITAWSLGVSVWRIAQREGCSEATIGNRINRSTAKIIHHFAGVDLQLEYLDEPHKGVVYAVVWEYPTGSGTDVVPMKIYIGGKGLWKQGKYLRDAQNDHKIERLRKQT